MGALRLADHECPYSIWLEQEAGDGWSWELIDREGETSVCGRAAGRALALEAARAAAAQADVEACGDLLAASTSGC